VHLLSEAPPRAASRIVEAGIIATLCSTEFASAL
jgi:hypothetical protein